MGAQEKKRAKARFPVIVIGFLCVLLLTAEEGAGDAENVVETEAIAQVDACKAFLEVDVRQRSNEICRARGGGAFLAQEILCHGVDTVAILGEKDGGDFSKVAEVERLENRSGLDTTLLTSCWTIS